MRTSEIKIPFNTTTGTVLVPYTDRDIIYFPSKTELKKAFEFDQGNSSCMFGLNRP